MNDFTKSNNNHFINKYGKTLNQLTWFTLPPAQDPLNILDNKPIVKEKVKEKVPTFIPNEIMSNILSYLPKPVIKPTQYSIFNREETQYDSTPYSGYFCIMKRLTASGKFMVYDKFKFTDRDNYRYFTIDTDCRSKLFKDKENRCYYIKNCGTRYNLDNRLPKRLQTLHGVNTLLTMKSDEYKKLLQTEYYRCLRENEELPIKIEADSKKDKEMIEKRRKYWNGLRII